jgi:dipeptidyl aminopeptidase/acylaminoacyl peptidase
VLAQDARADVEDVAVDPSTGRPLFALAEYDRARQIVVDPSWQKDEDYFSGLSPDSTHRLLGCTGDTTRCLWSLTTSDEPTRFYVYDRPRREADLLFVEQPSLLGLRLARMVPHEVLARDGLPLVAYVWLPPSTDPRGTGKPDHPLPTVVHPHDGGPWSRDSWGYSPVDQWLVSRGYAVVSVNYRGSFGFGRRFREAGDREWGGKMHDDVMDVLGWAELTHIADPQRVAMFGDSYGGYESLWALAMAPGTFRCAVDAFGVTDLPSMVAQAPPAILPPDEIARRVGEWWTPFGRAMLDARSPLSHAASIRQPVLIAHGARDVLVRLDQSERMVQALGLHQPDVTYMTFSDEGHIFHRPANRLAFGAAAETFLSQCLGGKAEPIGDAMRGDSVSVPVGADRIFGLVDALPRR